MISESIKRLPRPLRSKKKFSPQSSQKLSLLLSPQSSQKLPRLSMKPRSLLKKLRKNQNNMSKPGMLKKRLY